VRAALLLAALALALACGSAEEPRMPEPAPRAEAAREPVPPASLRASVVLEPPRIEIGDVFAIELAVVTPPGHRVAPAPVPKAVPGLVIVGADRPSVTHGPGRWVHHQRFRARARSTGPLRWPALELGVEAPDGTRQTVVAPERPFEVVSLLDEQPERRSPFSFRSPHLAEERSGPWLPALLGSLFTLAALGLVALVRRARRGGEALPASALAAEPENGAVLLAALGRAEAEGDPVRAADLASEALREWAAERFRAPFLRSATTEELAARPPPFLLTTRYPALVAALAALDALRFPPPRDDARPALADALARARALAAGTGGVAP
jgi:hypothetical protein